MTLPLRRRELLAAGIAAAWPPLASAAEPKRIAFLAQIARPQPLAPHIFGALPAALRALGWIEGQNLAIDWQFGGGDIAAVPELAAAIVKSHPDAIVTAGSVSSIAMRKATSTIPIVFGNVSDPMAVGLVTSLNGSGNNITGVVNFSTPLMPKLLELLLEAVPAARDVGLLVNPLQPLHAGILEAVRPLAQSRGVRVHQYRTSTAAEIEAAFAAMGRDGVSATFVPLEGLFIQHRKLAAQLALKHRIALAAFDLQFAEDGALLAYGADQHAIFRTVANYVDRILRGARPQELPVQQPTTFQLAVNAGTAHQLQLAVPQSVLLRADKVIGG